MQPGMPPETNGAAPQGPEQLPMPPTVGAEVVPHLPPLNTQIERGQEHFEQRAEAGARASDAAALAVSQAVPVSPTAQASNAPVATVAPSGQSPLVAADEDLIEKEWVDKAKQIIEQTQGDPHARTLRVNELQRDYLFKRYGKVVGAQE